MNGREDKKENDLFFVCSWSDDIARYTHNRRKVIVNALGKDELTHLYELADVYHCENIDKITHELIVKHQITMGSFDNVANCYYRIPTHWDMGKVYHRLIIAVSHSKKKPVIDSLIEVYNSWISDSLDNYNSSMYYENPSYLLASYQVGHPL